MLDLETVTKFGDPISVKPMEKGDVHAVDAVFEAMSPEARYFRFLQAMPRLSGAMRAALSDVDGARHRAAVARHGDRSIGLVRLVGDPAGEMELSVSVVDDWSRQGVGRLLATGAIGAAREAGVPLLSVFVHPQNRPAMSLFRDLGFAFTFDGGVMEGRLDLASVLTAA